VAAFASGIEEQYLERQALPIDQRDRRPEFFSIPQKDPYAGRIEEMKSRNNQ
jgi:hypothetical protein